VTRSAQNWSEAHASTDGWDGLPSHMTGRGKQDVFLAAAKDGFTAARNVTGEPVQTHGIGILRRAIDLPRSVTLSCNPACLQ
jgi:hypothetical protein